MTKKLKLLAFTGALALAIPAATHVSAQTVNVPVTIETNSAITLGTPEGIDFGEWLLVLSGDDVDNTLTMNAQDGTITPGNNPGGDTTDNSIRQLITAGDGTGSVAVTTPASATVSVSAELNSFTEATLDLSAPTFSVNGGAESTLSTDNTTPSTFVSTGVTADTLNFGVTLVATGTPPDAEHGGASIDVTFSY